MATFVLVHGAFGDGLYWGDTATALEAAGHRVTVAELPSTGPDPAALGGLVEDAAEVRCLLDGVDEPAVLVGHSYGGMVITEVADHPAIARTIYVAAARPRAGVSLVELMGTEPPDWCEPDETGTAMAVTPDLDVARAALCADVSRRRFRPWHARLTCSSLAALGAPSSAPARSHPVSYLICTRDAVVPVELQDEMAAGADAVVRLVSGHCPQLSVPEELAAVFEREAARTSNPIPA